MSNGLLGKKLGMTGLFAPDGKYVPVTVIQAGPCVVTQIKKKATDGYNALQLGFADVKDSRVNRPLKGHFKRSATGGFAHLCEFSVNDPEEFSPGQTVTVEMFSVGELVDVSGRTKGKGFAGVIKRHGFAGGRKTHGSRSHRIPGSIGCSAWPAKVIKGKKLPGHHGNQNQTVKNLEIIDIRADQHLILIKGAVPGAKSGLIEIQKRKTNQF